MTDIDDLVRERIEAARRRIERDRTDRARRKAARDAGLVERYRAKVAYLDRLDNTTLAASGT